MERAICETYEIDKNLSRKRSSKHAGYQRREREREREREKERERERERESKEQELFLRKMVFPVVAHHLHVLHAAEVEEVSRTVRLMVELLRIGKLELVAHAGRVTHTWKKRFWTVRRNMLLDTVSVGLIYCCGVEG